MTLSVSFTDSLFHVIPTMPQKCRTLCSPRPPCLHRARSTSREFAIQQIFFRCLYGNLMPRLIPVECNMGYCGPSRTSDFHMNLKKSILSSQPKLLPLMVLKHFMRSLRYRLSHSCFACRYSHILNVWSVLEILQ